MTVNSGEDDVEVDLPGPLGEVAFYGFLENLIRNVAKHNKEHLVEGRALHLFVAVQDESAERDFYTVRVWDQLTQPHTPRGVRLEGKQCATLCEVLQAYATAPIIDDGKLKRQAWGIGEMRICAALLRGSTDFVHMSEKDHLSIGAAPMGRLERLHEEDLRGPSDPPLPDDGPDRLVYNFYLMKSKFLVAVLPGLTDDAQLEALRRQGVWLFKSLDSLEAELTRADSLASFRFAVLDLTGKDGPERDRLLERILPQRRASTRSTAWKSSRPTPAKRTTSSAAPTTSSTGPQGRRVFG